MGVAPLRPFRRGMAVCRQWLLIEMGFEALEGLEDVPRSKKCALIQTSRHVVLTNTEIRQTESESVCLSISHAPPAQQQVLFSRHS